MEQNESYIQEIIKGIVDQKVIPFFGAGMSKACGAKDWTEIINNLKNVLSTNETDYLIIAQQYEDKFGRERLTKKLQGLCQLEVKNSESLTLHLRILAMNPPIIYTTNYDDALEEAASLIQKDYKSIVHLSDIVKCPHGAKQIIKFHGDFKDANSIVFTRNDYDKRLNIERHFLDVLFRSHILGKSVLFLGYGFGDENIQLIFDMHSELYGSGNTPRSYIISFKHDPKKEKELISRNVIPIVLSSLTELEEMIEKISSEVFDQSINNQFNSMLKPMPSEVLTSFELDHLMKYVKSLEFTSQQKYDKVREVLEGKVIAKDVESDLADLFEEVWHGDYDGLIKEAFVLAYRHTNFSKYESIVRLNLAILFLSENENFIYAFNRESSWASDVLMVMEEKTSSTFKDIIQTRKYTCIFVLSYLEAMMSEKKSLSFNQVDRLLDCLKNQGYEELGDLEIGFEQQHINDIIEHYLSQHNSTLRTKFNSKGMRGSRRPTISEIKGDILKNLPKNLS